MSLNNNFTIARAVADAFECFKEYREQLINDWIDQDPREPLPLTYGNMCERYELMSEDLEARAYADLFALYEDNDGVVRDGFSFNSRVYNATFYATIYDLIVDAIKHEGR